MFAFIIVALLVTVIALFLYLFLTMDCDFTLLISEKFGTKLSSLKNEVIWVTGASSGIGEALVYVLASFGSKLVLSGTNTTNLNEVRRKCLTLNPTLTNDDVLIVSFNIKDIEKHEDKVKEVLKHFNRIDVLVNNAGRSQRAAFEDIDLHVDKELFEINVFGTINLTRIIVKHWLETQSNGHLVVTSSIAGKFGAPYSASYTACKHALHGYFEAIRLEFFCRGINVTVACPGPVFTNIFKNAFTGKPGEVVGGQHKHDSNRMTVERCGQLMAIAIANRFDEVWMMRQPLLSILYFTQYCPTITRHFLSRFLTKERLVKLRDG